MAKAQPKAHLGKREILSCIPGAYLRNSSNGNPCLSYSSPGEEFVGGVLFSFVLFFFSIFSFFFMLGISTHDSS